MAHVAILKTIQRSCARVFAAKRPEAKKTQSRYASDAKARV
jgi:hypothetical protein